ncbi:hypothetical protein TRFO_29844 [Tritrichomonas foetus]|uniref:Protein kinase domain-containing protein n=1 Tax=Tritrichomonas foetus TaxID=1144522 RepID=A0A1J4K079_9EUKA|nr:hypothetical protein TRFO_29844 [Tritrichomonas foetus]|eukprot:OHT02917.1 hypothetical protein TRFO_29844 [Tritrichomonas foetus]
MNEKESVTMEMTKTSIAGTPLYMAPEIVDGEKYSSKIDVYAYSLIVYEILSGTPPVIEGNNPFQILFYVKNGIRPDLSHISNKTQRSFIEHCWCNDPKERYSFSQIVSFLLSSLNQGNTNNNENVSGKVEDISFIEEEIDQNEIEDYLEQFESLTTFQDSNMTNTENAFHDSFIHIESKEKKIEGKIQEGIEVKIQERMINNQKDPSSQEIVEKNGSQIAIDFTDSESLFNYANMLHNGEGIERNYSEAIKYYKMAIDKGNADAMNSYANMLKDGKGIEQNYFEAIRYYKMAIDKENSNAMNNYAFMLQKGEGIERNYSEAIRYYKMAIDKENSNAMYNYANMLQKGEGIERNYSEAIKYYKMAIDQGNADAMNSYALMLETGEGIERNSSKAVKYYKMAIDLGNPYAMFNYADMIEKKSGFILHINSSESIRYFKMSADHGCLEGILRYAKMLKKGQGTKRNYSEAIKYYKKAIDLGSMQAMIFYAKMLKKGQGIKQNLSKAAKYYQKAYKLGDLNALKEFKKISSKLSKE